MSMLSCRRGYTVVDLAVVMGIMATLMGTSGPLSRRVVSRYQLNSAVHSLAADLAQAKVRAIQTNAVVPVVRESGRVYQVDGHTRRLPGLVRFAPESAEALSFNGLGAMADGRTHTFVLTTSFGDAHEVRLYAAGGCEVRKL